jgi:hypothetical protein
LARVGHEVTIGVEGPVTLSAVLTALEAEYPMLQGTMRDHVTHKRRPYVRFYACETDLTHDSHDNPLPESVVSGEELLIVLGAIAGG